MSLVSTILIVIIGVLAVAYFVFFQVMVSMGRAGVSPGNTLRALHNMITGKSDWRIEASEKSKQDSVQKEHSKRIDFSKVPSIQRLRAASGLLLGLLMFGVFAVFGVGRHPDSVPLLVVYPVSALFLLSLALISVVVFYMTWRREQEFIKNQTMEEDVKAHQTDKFRLTTRILFGILSLIFCSISYSLARAYYYDSQYDSLNGIMVCFGFGVMFFWVSITGRKPRWHKKGP